MKDLRQIQTERIELIRESMRETILEDTGLDPFAPDWEAYGFSVK